MLDRKLKKYCKRVDDKVNTIHQKLAPIRQSHIPIPSATRTSEEGGRPLAQGRERVQAQQRNLTTQTSSANLPSPSSAREEHSDDESDGDGDYDQEEGVERAEEDPVEVMPETRSPLAAGSRFEEEEEEGSLNRLDTLLYAPSSPKSPPPPPPPLSGSNRIKENATMKDSVTFEERMQRISKPFSSLETPTRSGLKDISNSRKALGKEEQKVVEKESKASSSSRGRETSAIAILLSVCDFLEEDVNKEPYLTLETVEMIHSAGELLSKGWNDSGLLKKAHELFRMAALEGSVAASRCVGLFHKTGISGAKDPVAARKWFGLGAGTGDPISCFMLGQMLELGEGGPVDAKQALQHYSTFEERSKTGAGLVVSKILDEHSNRTEGTKLVLM